MKNSFKLIHGQSGSNTCLSRNTQLFLLARLLYQTFGKDKTLEKLTKLNENELCKIYFTQGTNTDHILKIYHGIIDPNNINRRCKPTSYESKYLKYKTKYLELKKLKNL